ncbi:hypothetical protein H6789_02705 [Candidatus Nomurabacteria bacterium]|nr:hypothetical protein [Candidatus Nomurabacteria bacterium]MCB9819587.1 hypothetical protein [Candidatus Nomurabacteria bacterium]
MKNKFYYLLSSLILLFAQAFAYYTISPLFIDIVVDEASPITEGTIETEILESKPAEVIGTSGHPVSGTTRLIEVDGEKYVRYEDFKTINGLDIFVYLAKDLEVKEFVSLGKIRGTEESINYTIPAEVDASNTDHPNLV